MKKLSFFLVLLMLLSGCSSYVRKTTQAELDDSVAEYKQMVEDNNDLQRLISEKLGSDAEIIERCQSVSQKLQSISERFQSSEKLKEYSYLASIKTDMEDAKSDYENLRQEAQNRILNLTLQ